MKIKMVENRKLFYAISLMLLTCCQIIATFPHNVDRSSESLSNNSENNNAAALDSNSNQNMNNNNNNNDADSDFLIVAVERKQQHTINSNVGIWETQDNDSTAVDNIDDLIFLDKRPINHHQQQHNNHHHQYEKLQQQRKEQLHQHHQQQQQQNEQHNMEFHHVTMDGGISSSNSNEDTDSLTHTTYSTMHVVDDDDDDNDNDDETAAAAAALGLPHEIELQPADINEEVTTLYVTPLDLSDFLSLIPATKVKTIVNHYYHNDPEVQRAHAFMSSRDFFMLKQPLIAVPEMSAFLRYLNNSGLDLVKFVTALTNLTSYEVDDNAEKQIKATTESATMTATTEQIANIVKTNDIEYAQKQSNTIIPTISNTEIQIQTTTTAATTTTPPQQPPATLLAAATKATMDAVETTTAKEQLNGLHGLVDSVLDVLPQDQILATFFDKLEANEQFSKLVDSIGSPEFAKILNNMQCSDYSSEDSLNSIPLRNLIFTLHNNGIYVIRIVDSLKSYFFLGGF